jgi:hypothetical protein
MVVMLREKKAIQLKISKYNPPSGGQKTNKFEIKILKKFQTGISLLLEFFFIRI